MKAIISSIKGIFGKRPMASGVDPVYHFFFETSSRKRKKVYTSALKKAQQDQERISIIAKEKVRA